MVRSWWKPARRKLCPLLGDPGVTAEGPPLWGWVNIEKMKEVGSRYSFRLNWRKESTRSEYDGTHWKKERESAVRDAD